MFTATEYKQFKADLIVTRVVFAAMLMMPIIYIAICASMERGPAIPAEPPIMLRTILYFVAIAAFPFINLIRHIMLRLNQTMPGDTPAKSRYFTTVAVSLVLSEAIAIMGLLLYFQGDEFNTLLIFSLLSLLSMALYRPKIGEYSEIVSKMKQNGDR